MASLTEERSTSSRARLSGLLQRTRDALAPYGTTADLLPRPGTTALVRRPGPDPHHILLVGGGALAGVGLAQHDLGLPGRLADLLCRRTQRGAQIQVAVEEHIPTEESIARLRSLRLRRFDAVVVFIGAAPAEHGVADATWRASIEQLARTLDAEAAPTAPLHVYDSSTPEALLSLTSGGTRVAARATRLTEVSEEVFEQTRRIRFQSFRPAVGHRGPAGAFSASAYEEWAEAIVGRLHTEVARLDGQHGPDTPAAYRDRPQSSTEQARAAARMIEDWSRYDGAFPQEVLTLQKGFGVEGGAIALLHEGRLRPIAASSRTLRIDPAPAAQLCDLALQQDPLTLVNDASQERTPEARSVAAAGLRFWASRPIHSWDGYRIGAVYLFDSRPHDLVPTQLDLVHDVSRRVEQHLWTTTPQRAIGAREDRRRRAH